jgi:hypothetical protein
MSADGQDGRLAWFQFLQTGKKPKPSEARCRNDQDSRSRRGIEAQRKAIEYYLNGGRWELLAEFFEVESGARRPAEARRGDGVLPAPPRQPGDG